MQKITLPFVGSSREANGTKDALFGYVFGNVSGVETTQYYSATGYSKYKIPSSLKSVTITDADVIPYGAFYNCSNLDNIILNSTISAVLLKKKYNANSKNSLRIGMKIQKICTKLKNFLNKSSKKFAKELIFEKVWYILIVVEEIVCFVR